LLIGGDPGIGKSALLLKSQSTGTKYRILYVGRRIWTTGEVKSFALGSSHCKFALPMEEIIVETVQKS